MAEELKIALVDDQSLCRRGLGELLARCYGFNVLGAVGTIEARSLIRTTRPAGHGFAHETDGRTADAGANTQEGCTIPAVVLTMSDSEVDLGTQYAPVHAATCSRIWRPKKWWMPSAASQRANWLSPPP
jgi:DNA-binding NarL/FixJ family response regulator